MTAQDNNKILIGWREWVALPELGIPAIKAKIDTGAKTSALHAFQVDPFSKNGVDHVRFKIHPLQKNSELEVECEAPVLDQRVVSDSGGHKELRYVIQAPLQIGERNFPIEITLTNRENMLFRMLIGRRAMEEAMIVDPELSYQQGKLDIDKIYPL